MKYFFSVFILTLSLLLSLTIIPVQSFARADHSKEKMLNGTWHLYPGTLGKIDVNNRNKEIKHHINFDKNHGYSYLIAGRDNPFNGQWELKESDGKTTLLLQRSTYKKPRVFNVLKFTRQEIILQSEGKTMLFIADAHKRPGIDRFRGVLGILTLLLIAFSLSNNRKKINWRTPAVGILIQLVFAVSVLKVGFIRNLFQGVSSFFVQLLAFTREGSLFLFGDLISNTSSFGYIFAFQVLPTVIFFSAFTSVLYYFGILQFVVKMFAWVMQRAMSLSGAESLAAAANIFIGQTEAPLVIKPYLPVMTKSEMMALMTGGMATIAGGVLAAYIGFLGGPDPEQQKIFATHLLTASIMNAPAALFFAKIMFPETGVVNKELTISREVIGSNLLDSIAKGTIDGLRLAVNVGAMLLVFIALMALLNYIVTNWIGQPTGLNDLIRENSNGRFDGLNMQFILGMIFSPIAWLIGVPTNDIFMVGQLLGEKSILNEFYAYVSLGNLKSSFLLTDEKSVLIATYALCGFANFSSIGIQIGGISALAPNQRVPLSQLGIKALIGGTLATLMTASIAGIIL